ncbi:Protein TIFY 5A [Quillaja saponaria]|uniref:Protein TIFY n=1 Tax=Quillaja saponaria TaxID=32244 RepID=A0AAD7P9M2_QUISA|nr:Protein TIFY 5A [Quillaja saponaria]
MRRNCNLELRLLPPSASGHHHYCHHPMEEASGSPQEQQLNYLQQQQDQQQKQLTIFYNGKMCVCDVTEIQAREILMVASRKMEEKVLRTPSGTGSGSGSSEPSSPMLMQTPSPHNQLYSPTTITTTASPLSMKISLQRFLQKRKNRIQETSPYHH